VLASISATIPPLHMKGGGKYDQSLLVVIIIFTLNECWIVHWLRGFPGVPYKKE
jgi:hypothetical protein